MFFALLTNNSSVRLSCTRYSSNLLGQFRGFVAKRDMNLCPFVQNHVSIDVLMKRAVAEKSERQRNLLPAVRKSTPSLRSIASRKPRSAEKMDAFVHAMEQ